MITLQLLICFTFSAAGYAKFWSFVAFSGRLSITVRLVSQLTPITVDRFQHELRLHPNPHKVVHVVQGLGDGFHLGFNYGTSLKSAGGVWLCHS